MHIACDIILKLSLPELNVGFGVIRKTATFVTVPKATMDKKRDLPTDKRQVGAAWEVAAMKPEPVAHVMDNLPDRDFRLGFLSPNPAHHL